VLAFYPADSSPVCTRQLVSYTAGIAELAALDAVLLAISPQDVASHRDFAAAHGGFAFPLLSDTDKAVGRSYGIVGLLDLYRRSTFIIDADGVVAHAHRYLGPGLGYKPLAQIAGLVASIAG
jgi:peroxiredoxin Q/BCP